MRILVLGGTVFLGRHVVEAALARGHDLTLFNRGQSAPGLFPGVEEVHGDRATDLGKLAGRSWDAVIDTSGYLPRVVRASARAMSGSTGHYTFISTVSVYRALREPGMDESAPLAALDDPTSEDVQANYGPLKALCEAEVEAALPGRSLILRPGLIVGPWDPSDRFSYWPWRLARGGDGLAPGRPGRQVQVIDARDLAAWNLDLVERGATGTFNATGPARVLTMEAMLRGCAEGTGSGARFVWAGDEFLIKRKVAPWMGLPLWLPETDVDSRGLLAVSVDRALAAGLRFRPLGETARDTLAWLRTRPQGHQWKAGISAQREAELLAELGSSPP
ncbi:MAG: epimerase [Chloroflexi bacterium]|nr:epimerase [Chloroflexota bacterium]